MSLLTHLRVSREILRGTRAKSRTRLYDAQVTIFPERQGDVQELERLIHERDPRITPPANGSDESVIINAEGMAAASAFDAIAQLRTWAIHLTVGVPVADIGLAVIEVANDEPADFKTQPITADDLPAVVHPGDQYLPATDEYVMPPTPHGGPE